MRKLNWVTLSRVLILSLNIGLLLYLSLFFSGCKLYTVVKLNRDQAQNQGFKVPQDTNFDADKFIIPIWETKVIPYLTNNTKEAGLVLSEYRKDPDQAGEQFGIRASDEGNPWNFIIKGKGKIISVNTTSLAGTIDIDMAPYDGKFDLKIQIGPVIKNSSIRDSLNFVSINNFENQLDFAKLSNAFNKKIYNQLLSKIDFKKTTGKEIEFTGVFTADNPSEILLTPVFIMVH